MLTSNKDARGRYYCILVLLFLFVIAWVNVAHAATYYIDFQNGNDNNTGTSPLTAWKTIQGTRNTWDTADQSTKWGTTFSSSRRVPAGTVFKLKSGSAHNSANGGRVHISSTYYDTDATASNPILFQRDTTWGSGSVTFDGTGITLYDSNKWRTGWGLIHIKEGVGGISFDGVSGVSNKYDGIVVQNSAKIGVSYQADNVSIMQGGVVQFIKFYNNGTLYNINDKSFAGSGQLYVKYHDQITIRYCEFNGNNLYTNGIHLGQSYTRVTNCSVSDCIAYNHNGTDATDVGIGFKGQNSQITYRNCVAYNNISKGFDNGEEWAKSSWDIIYMLSNCSAHNNVVMGAGFSVTAAPRVGFGTFYIINCIFRDNGGPGVKMYAGPYTGIVVHSVFDNNNINILAHPDGISDTSNVTVRYYNNIFYKPSGNDGNTSVGYWKDGQSNYVRESDYNSYVQSSSEYFSRWGCYGGGSDQYDFSYGVEGPGFSNSRWYKWQAWYNDAHSKGTGSGDSTLPPFEDVANHNYMLTGYYQGVNLTEKAWYVPEMGMDRNGVLRVSWDMGPYEYLIRPSLPKGLRIIR